MTEDEMVGWHHRLNGHKFEQAVGVGDGQGSLVCCSPWVGDSGGQENLGCCGPWGRKDNSNNKIIISMKTHK